MIPATGRNGQPGTNRRPQEVIDTLGRLEVATNQRVRETQALADLAIQHRAVIAQCLQTLVVVDPRRRDAVAEPLAELCSDLHWANWYAACPSCKLFGKVAKACPECLGMGWVA